MALPLDKISKPKRGRFFPLQAAEIRAKIKEHSFRVYDYDKRLPLVFENCDVECRLGLQLASFLRMSYLAVYSSPESMDEILSQRALEYAIEEFSRIDRGPHLATRDQQIVIYRAYLSRLKIVSVTQNVVNAGNRSYLMFRKISKISKSGWEAGMETVLVSKEVA